MFPPWLATTRPCTILTTAFDFVNSSCMEPTVKCLPWICEARSFPWYLHDQTGIGKAFTLFIFAKSSKITIIDYIQAIPDMNYWISCINDFLSFVLSFVLARKFADPISYDLADFTKNNLEGKQGITFITVHIWRASPQCKFMLTVISRKFLIKYYENSFDYLIIIMNQLQLTLYLVYSMVCSLPDTDLQKLAK